MYLTTIPLPRKEDSPISNRDVDLDQLRSDYKRAGPEDRRRIEIAAHKIRNESGKIRSMRDSLIKAHRSGNKGAIAGIHSWTEDHKEYRNER